MYCESWMSAKNRLLRCLKTESPTATKYLGTGKTLDNCLGKLANCLGKGSTLSKPDQLFWVKGQHGTCLGVRISTFKKTGQLFWVKGQHFPTVWVKDRHFQLFLVKGLHFKKSDNCYWGNCFTVWVKGQHSKTGQLFWCKRVNTFKNWSTVWVKGKHQLFG